MSMTLGQVCRSLSRAPLTSLQTINQFAVKPSTQKLTGVFSNAIYIQSQKGVAETHRKIGLLRVRRSVHGSEQGLRSKPGVGLRKSGALRIMTGENGQKEREAGENKPSEKKRRLTIDIVSDTMCPWCFVGKKNLEKAMEMSKAQYDFEVIWRPFQLNPDAPKEGMNKRGYYRQKFGETKTKMIIERMTEVFKGLGYEYCMDGLVGNSFDSHRLLEFAKEQGKQNEVCEELFLNSFVRAKYLGNKDYLVEAAEAVGITGAREFLDDPDAGAEQVRDDLRTCARGISGVPHFFINGQVELTGAQPPSALLEAFKDAVSAVA